MFCGDTARGRGGWCSPCLGFHHLPGVLVHDIAAAGVAGEYQLHGGTVHPFLGTNGSGIADGLFHASQVLGTIHDVRRILEETETAADGIVVGDAAIDAHGREVLDLVTEKETEREQKNIFFPYGGVREMDIHDNLNTVMGMKHPDIVS